MSGPTTHPHPLRRRAWLTVGRTLAAAIVAVGGVFVAAAPAAGATGPLIDATVRASGGSPVVTASGEASGIPAALQEDAVPPEPEPTPAPTVAPAPEPDPEPSSTASPAPTDEPSPEPSAEPVADPEASPSAGEPEASPSAEATPVAPVTEPSPSPEPPAVEPTPSAEPAATELTPATDPATSTDEETEPEPAAPSSSSDVNGGPTSPAITTNGEAVAQPQPPPPPDSRRATAGSIHASADAAFGTGGGTPAATPTPPPAAEAGPATTASRSPPPIARNLPFGGPGTTTMATRLAHPDGAVQAAAFTGSGLAIALNRASPVSVAVDFARAGGGWAGPLVFNVWLRRQLRERRMSQRQLGMLSGVDHSAISRLVNGHASPTLETAAKLVHALRLEWTDQQVATYFELLPERTLFPTQRVESALRGDGTLDDEDVRAVMHQYLALRKRRKRVAATEAPPGRPRELRETGGP